MQTERQSYIKPEVTVCTFKSEVGYAGSGLQSFLTFYLATDDTMESTRQDNGYWGGGGSDDWF